MEYFPIYDVSVCNALRSKTRPYTYKAYIVDLAGTIQLKAPFKSGCQRKPGKMLKNVKGRGSTE